MGKVFEKAIGRLKGKILIDQEIIQIIESLKKENMEERISIDEALERLINYCEQKKYSNSIDIIDYLKKYNKNFIQEPFSDDLSSVNHLKPKKEEKEENIFVEDNFVIENNHHLNERKIINGFICILIDSSLGKFEIENKKNYCYFYKNFKFNLNPLGFPFFVEKNNYIYFVDNKNFSFVRFDLQIPSNEQNRNKKN